MAIGLTDHIWSWEEFLTYRHYHYSKVPASWDRIEGLSYCCLRHADGLGSLLYGCSWSAVGCLLDHGGLQSRG